MSSDPETLNGADVTEVPDGKEVRLTRVIDFRIPLPYLLTGIGALVVFLFTLHTDVRQLLRDVSKMQATAEAGNAQLNSITSEQSLQRYRLDNLESDVRAIKKVVPAVGEKR